MELFKVKTIIVASCKVEQTIHVFANDMEHARQEAAKSVNKIGTTKIKRAILTGGTDLMINHTKCFPTLIAPVKGKKRSTLTRIQKEVLVNMLQRGGGDAQLRYTPSTGWVMTGAAISGTWGAWNIDIKTIIALRQKNLILPMTMDDTERRVQQAIGTFEVGEFRFILNMKEVRKRKVYRDHARPQ